MAATSRGKAKTKADVLFSKIVRSRGACIACQQTHALQCCHIVSRRYSNTRTDENNAFCMCAGCHLFYTEWPFEFTSFITRTIGEEAYSELRAKALRGGKVDWSAEVERLSEIWKRIEVSL